MQTLGVTSLVADHMKLSARLLADTRVAAAVKEWVDWLLQCTAHNDGLAPTMHST